MVVAAGEETKAPVGVEFERKEKGVVGGSWKGKKKGKRGTACAWLKGWKDGSKGKKGERGHGHVTARVGPYKRVTCPCAFEKCLNRITSLECNRVITYTKKITFGLLVKESIKNTDSGARELTIIKLANGTKKVQCNHCKIKLAKNKDGTTTQ
ncbi:hypothetical protein GOBAR_AA22370 [Gossypium barbadense]|uniref:Uncharacterized protein n=1 Tax=Gossypium barbadense TaxID=3634 RepID=A0A2P5X4M7_GOSBA|nr:hypothetical protein GOBAR_AA22370 [Gossypium barbadense]